MTTTMEAPRHYEAAVRAMSAAAAEVEATQAPIRMAYWRMAALDSVLSRLEELRLTGDRALPDELGELIQAYAETNDPELMERILQARPDDLNAVHDAVFEAQGRVMLQLAELRRVPNWQDLDTVLEPDGEEAA
jgi:DNA-binding transcriptional regulator YbjK